MKTSTPLGLVLTTTLLMMMVPLLAVATPPAHAPAHGHRAKHKASAPAPKKPGIQISFDSERGIQVAVGFPDIVFHDGHYYRQHDGGWQISFSGDGGWRVAVESKIPGAVRDARKKSHPGPAKKKHGKHR